MTPTPRQRWAGIRLMSAGIVLTGTGLFITFNIADPGVFEPFGVIFIVAGVLSIFAGVWTAFD